MATNPDTSMNLDPPLPSKRRRLSLLDTIRVRNGGSNTSFLSVANTPPSAREPDGSDTEDEEDEETAQYYLNKMSDDTERTAETVFGAGVEVWRSFGGTVYADLSEGVKRKMREEELRGEEAREKVAGGLKRKMAAEQAAKSSSSSTTTNPTSTSTSAPNPNSSENSDVVYPALPQPTTYPNLPSNQEDKLAFPPAPSPTPTSAYPTRNPLATQFHHSSAGIDPMGAHNRPIKPLPSRRLAKPSTTAKCNSPLPLHWHHLQTKAPQHPPSHSLRGLLRQDRGDHQLDRSTQPLRRNAVPTLDSASTALPIPMRRIVSGSFGSFEGSVGRFDERAYRLGQVGKENEKKLDIFKGRPWLRE